MLLDLIEESQLQHPVVFYYEVSDVLLWRDFVTAEGQKRFKSPQLMRIHKNMADYEIM